MPHLTTRLMAPCALAATLAVTPAAAQGRAIDVVVCIEASADMRVHIDALRASAGLALDRVFALDGAVRVGLVAYAGGESGARVDVVPLTAERGVVRDALSTLPLRGVPGGSAALRGALLAAIRGQEIGTWRRDAAKVVVVVGRLDAGLDAAVTADVSAALEGLGGVRLFGVPIGDIASGVGATFASWARQTGGAILPGIAAPDLADGVVRMVGLGQSFGAIGPDADAGDGVVARVMGTAFEAEFAVPAPTGADVTVFSSDAPEIVIAVGSVILGSDGRFIVETRYSFTTEPVHPGCRVRWVRE